MLHPTLSELLIYPEINRLTFEKRKKLKLAGKAELQIESGNLIIIDPGYTNEHRDIFSHGVVRTVEEPAFLRLLNQYGRQDYAVIQGRKAVYLGNFGGDGNFPVVRTRSGLEILLEYCYTTIKEALDPKLYPHTVGSVWVDYRMMMIVDGSKITQVEDAPDIPKVSINVDPGKYSVAVHDTGEARERYSPGGKRGLVARIAKISK